MRLLFVKHSMAWPRASGHDILMFHMLKACGDLGHEVSLATVVPPEPPAIEGAAIREYVRLTAPLGADANEDPLPGTRLQHRFRSFWGIEDHWARSLRSAIRRLRPEAVIAGGLDALPFFPVIKQENTIGVLYAADEWVLHHLSMLQFRRGHLIDNLRGAAIKGLYERAHRSIIDRAWVVTESDRRAMHRMAGIRHVDVVQTGIDINYYKPGPEAVEPQSAIFWGRLDFGPNVQALEWFCQRVWPLVRGAAPGAKFTIAGFQPTAEVKALTAGPGISLEANVRDLRPVARRHALAALPLVSGAGIKNKLLEAAAMGLPVVCTPRATLGLQGNPPVVTAEGAPAFAKALLQAWDAGSERAAQSRAIRDWVTREHSWRAAAVAAVAALEGHRATRQ